MPNKFARSPEIDAYNDTLSRFRHAPGKHVWFMPTADYCSIKSVLDQHDDFILMTSFVNSEGEQTKVFSCSARGLTVLVEDGGDGSAIVGIRAKKLKHLADAYEDLSEMASVLFVRTASREANRRGASIRTQSVG